MADIVFKIYNEFSEDKFFNEWQELYLKGYPYNLSPEWCKLWFDIFGKDKKLYIIAIYNKHDALKLVAPMYLKNNILSFIGTRPILFDECSVISETREHIEVLLDYIFENKFDINFEHVNTKSDFACVLTRFLCAKKIKHFATVSETKQIIVDEFNPKHGELKNINRQKRYVVNNMNDEVVFEYNVEKNDKSINELINLHKQRWSLLKEKQGLQEYFKNLMKSDNVVLSRLSLKSNNVTLGYELGIIDSSNKYWFLMGACDYNYHKISPGKVIMYELTKYLMENGVTKLDLGRGCEEYKAGYANQEDILLFFTSYNSCPCARLYVSIFHLVEKIVKLIRKTY